MRTILFFTLAFVISLVSCKKEELLQKKETRQQSINGDDNRYSGVKLIETKKYGKVLAFDRVEDFWTLEEMYKDGRDTDWKEWEDGIGFRSLRAEQWDAFQKYLKNETRARPYVGLPEVTSMIINPKGYVMFGGRLYQETDNGQKTYLIEDGERKLVHEVVSHKSDCSEDVDEKDVSGYPCYRYGTGYDTYLLRAEMGFYDTWFSKYDYVYAESYQEIASCNTWGNSAAFGNLFFTATYDVTIDGVPYKSSTSQTLYNQASGWVKIVDGENLCVNNVSATHTSTHGSARLSVNTYIGS